MAHTSSGKRLALLFDVSLTACLMMGVLSSGVKRHAVTMYEVRYMCTVNLLSHLLSFCLLSAIVNAHLSIFPLLACRVLLLIMLQVGKLAHEGVDILLHDLDETRALAASSKSPTQAYTDQAVHLSLLLRFLRESSALKNTASRSVAARPVRDSSRSLSSAGESISSLTSDSSLPLAVDLVRCESLAGLDPATRKRILQRNYHTLLALAPLGDDVQPPMRSGDVIMCFVCCVFKFCAWFNPVLLMQFMQCAPAAARPSNPRVQLAVGTTLACVTGTMAS